MHGAIRNRLEELLRGGRLAGGEEVKQHLVSCGKCRAELDTMESQSGMIRLLRAPETVEPAPGFYARVLQRIEETARISIWAALAYSPISSRIAYVTLTLALVLGGYVIASESRDGDLRPGESIVAQTVHVDVPVVGDASQQRQAVLQNFATH